MSNPIRALTLLLPFLGLVACTDHPQAAAVPKAGEGGLVVTNPESDRPYYFDFQHAVYGERLRHVFVLHNAEGRPLTIKDMLASCGCTQPRTSYVDSTGARVEGAHERGKEVITVPKDTDVEVSVELDTTLVHTMNMDKLETVRIRTDSAANPYVNLEIHVVVVRAFRAVPAKVELFDTPQTAGKSARTDITTDVAGNKSRIQKIVSIEGTFTAELQEAQVAGETDWILTVTAPPGLPLGPAKGSVTMTTTNADGKGDGATFTVPILAQIVTDVVIDPLSLAKNDVDGQSGATLDAQVKALVPGARVRVLAVALEGERSSVLRVESTPISPDAEGRAERHALKLIVPPGTPPGVYSGKISVAIDAELQHTVTVPYSVTVK